MIWSQKLAQQTSQLLQQKKHKKCTASLMIWSQKLAQQTAQLTTRKSTKKTTTFRLRKHNFPAQKFTTAAPPNPQVVLNLQSTRACQPSLSLDPAWGPCHQSPRLAWTPGSQVNEMIHVIHMIRYEKPSANDTFKLRSKVFQSKD